MQDTQKHPCHRIYEIGSGGKIYGQTQGICRITGQEGKGLPFEKWVKDTFTDHSWLKPGAIISNEALFCFDELSEIIQKKNNRDKLQKFRTYSHLIDASGNWHCCTKADKKLIYRLITEGATLVCLSDSGQKHMVFKHRTGMWQLDEMFVTPDIPRFIGLHTRMCSLLELGFSQKEVITGQYLQYRILQTGLDQWKEIEDSIKQERFSPFFNFAAWLLFTIK